jgi:hypothetical protein
MMRCTLIALLLLGLTGLPASAAENGKPTFFPIDLSHQVTNSLFEPMLTVTGSDLSELAAGVPPTETPRKTLKGIPYRLDGVVLVGPGESSNGLTDAPVTVVKKVQGIPVGKKVDRLYFLHATKFSAADGATIGSYIVHYADETKEEIPIRYGVDVRDWWVNPNQVKEASEGQIVWTGQCEAATRNGSTIRLFMKNWKNPHPEQEIKSFDLVTGDRPAGRGAPTPFLVAVTGAVD